MIYIAAMNAKRTDGISAMTPAISAAPYNDEEAEGHFLRLARRRWPIEEGWTGHAVSCHPLPPDSGYYWEPADFDPMSPDYAALAAHEHPTATEQSRDDAGLGAGPFVPSITTLEWDENDPRQAEFLRNRELLRGPELADA